MKRVPTCPVCDRPLDEPLGQWPFFPFCSKKCRTIDLGRWLTGEYELPAIEPDLGDAEEEPS